MNLNQQLKQLLLIPKRAGSNKIMNDDNNLEINDFEDDEASDSDDETSRLKQQVYSRYSKKEIIVSLLKFYIVSFLFFSLPKNYK